MTNASPKVVRRCRISAIGSVSTRPLTRPAGGTYRLVRNVPPQTPVTVVMATRAEFGTTRAVPTGSGGDDGCASDDPPDAWSDLPGVAAGQLSACSKTPPATLGVAGSARPLDDHDRARSGLQPLSVRGPGLGRARSGSAERPDAGLAGDHGRAGAITRHRVRRSPDRRRRRDHRCMPAGTTRTIAVSSWKACEWPHRARATTC